MQYGMLAIDLDGTLLDSHGRASRANLDAIGRAIDAGVRVVPCTGRAWCESRQVLRQFPDSPLASTGVFVTGAAISDLATGQSLDLAVLEPHLALEVVEHLWELPEAVLVFRDGNQTGHDYLVTGAGRLTANTQWWFEQTGASVHVLDRVTLDDVHHTLRVGVVAVGTRMPATMKSVRAAFGPRVAVHHFEAVQKPDPQQTVHVMEVFAAGVDKWRGLTRIAHEHGIEAGCIAAIGDAINDTVMVREAGCGIAMANAVEDTTAAADHTTLSCDEDGVAHAIEQLLAGRWG